uniref:Uncharacterized protein n=1 Tax=Anopheles melas TaxID=34690 RepID=A0A182THK4_9DIPT
MLLLLLCRLGRLMAFSYNSSGSFCFYSAGSLLVFRLAIWPAGLPTLVRHIRDIKCTLLLLLLLLLALLVMRMSLLIMSAIISIIIIKSRAVTLLAVRGNFMGVSMIQTLGSARTERCRRASTIDWKGIKVSS